MDTLHQPPVNPPDPQAATPYFRRCAVFAETVEGIARWYRGGPLQPETWAA
jgi:hypothetical protein